MSSEENDALSTTAEGAPVTFQRDPAATNLTFEKPYLPRALEAVDNDHPYGTKDYPNHGLTVLQQHVAFFDRNGDGKIYPWETYTGFRRIGFNPILCFLAAVMINGALSYLTVPGWFPSPLFAIYIRDIHKAKHGSDSGTYDTEGRFVPAKFEEIFTKYATTHRDRITFEELLDMTSCMRNALDPFGWFANKLEWVMMFKLIKDEEGYASKEAIRGVFDGSVFYSIEKAMNKRIAASKLKTT